MPRSMTHLISASLIGLGVIAWAFISPILVNNPKLAAPLNFMGINRSPYGEVIAMAMQGPIETNFNAVNLFGGNQYAVWWHMNQKLGGDKAPAFPKFSPNPAQLADNALKFLAVTPQISTNPRLPSKAQKLHLRGKAESQLLFAYHLDPSHYGNYAALHFFLNEGIGTNTALTPHARKLADDTIQYCLAKTDDPRPALTAAAASISIIHLMFEDRNRNPNSPPKFSTADMRKYLATLDSCIARYQKIDTEWTATGQWSRISQDRAQECRERIAFTQKLRDAAEGGIIHLETGKKPNTPPPSIARDPSKK